MRMRGLARRSLRVSEGLCEGEGLVTRKWRGLLGGRRKGRIPAQFTSEEGAGRDLYACHNKDAVFARLLSSRSGSGHVMRQGQGMEGDAYQT